MASLNKVQLIGNLGREPEVRTHSGKPIATLSLATSERWTDKETGELKEATEWHRVVLHGRNAELARELAYRLYTISERKKRAPEALAYNGLVQSWPEIQHLWREGGTSRTEQAQLFPQE